MTSWSIQCLTIDFTSFLVILSQGLSAYLTSVTIIMIWRNREERTNSITCQRKEKSLDSYVCHFSSPNLSPPTASQITTQKQSVKYKFYLVVFITAKSASTNKSFSWANVTYRYAYWLIIWLPRDFNWVIDWLVGLLIGCQQLSWSG